MRWSHECHTDNTNAIDARPDCRSANPKSHTLKHSCRWSLAVKRGCTWSSATRMPLCHAKPPAVSAPLRRRPTARKHTFAVRKRGSFNSWKRSTTSWLGVEHEQSMLGQQQSASLARYRKRAKEAAANAGLPLGITRVETAQSDV